MAEEAPGVQNKWLLVIAVVIGLVVVALHNVHVGAVRRQARGRELQLLRTRVDLEPGARIERADLEVVTIREENAEPFGNVLTERDIGTAVRENVNQRIPAGRWLTWEHFLGEAARRPAESIDPDKVSCVIDIDGSPGELLTVGDRVNVLGVFAVGGRGARTYRVVESVPVIAIDGRTEPGTRRTNFRQVQVIVDREVSPKLKNVLTHRRGEVWLEVLHPEAGIPEDAGQINPELTPLTESAAGDERGQIQVENDF